MHLFDAKNVLFNSSEIDAYGFKHGEDFDYDSYEEFMSRYLSILARRASKWNKLLSGSGSVKRSSKGEDHVLIAGFGHFSKDFLIHFFSFLTFVNNMPFNLACYIKVSNKNF